MIEVKFEPCEKVYFYNTAYKTVERTEIKAVQVVPTGISKDEKGENVLDGYDVLYQTVSGGFITESEAFATEEECRKAHLEALSK